MHILTLPSASHLPSPTLSLPGVINGQGLPVRIVEGDEGGVGDASGDAPNVPNPPCTLR
eukprot:NODE_8388_length_290_cov_6.763485_g7648_i0.p4 GENE.NODE_8388_length_290_cov_6.763485_g7648_i0~~NODE_8388_length_290_cov_6.763485_g7648_i0.p4  ORF type:complete len:59 (-),score=11.39 NODE_8388_length_290_cov_6.763485_g7648_i0:4-180(-)